MFELKQVYHPPLRTTVDIDCIDTAIITAISNRGPNFVVIDFKDLGQRKILERSGLAIKAE